jgi:hypothetical protein
VSDSLLASLDRLAALEAEKRTLAVDDPRTADLAREVQQLASRVLTKSAIQREITEQAVAGAGQEDAEPAATGASRPPGMDAAEILRPMRSVALILDEWRAAERRLAAATPGTPAWGEAALDSRRLRAEYHRAHDQLQR